MWYLNINNNREGPLDDQQVADLAARGSINANTLGWKQGMPEWLPLGRTELARLFASQGGGAPPPIIGGGGYPPNPGGTRAPIAGIADIKTAGTDAWQALKLILTDPVGKLTEAYQTLGRKRAIGVGIVFGVVFALSMIVFLMSLRSKMVAYYTGGLDVPSAGLTVKDFVKAFFSSIVPYVSLTGACFAAQKVFRGRGDISHDCFIAGVAVLPLAVLFLVSSVLSASSPAIVVSFVLLFPICLTIILLFAGVSRLCGITEKLAIFAVPLMFIATVWFSYLIYKAANS